MKVTTYPCIYNGNIQCMGRHIWLQVDLLNFDGINISIFNLSHSTTYETWSKACRHQKYVRVICDLNQCSFARWQYNEKYPYLPWWGVISLHCIFWTATQFEWLTPGHTLYLKLYRGPTYEFRENTRVSPTKCLECHTVPSFLWD